MGIAALVTEVGFALALLAGLLWLGKRAWTANNLEGKGRMGRKSGKDRRVSETPVHRDRRQEPRRQGDVAKAFLDDLEDS
jgi:hypothetical protein